MVKMVSLKWRAQQGWVHLKLVMLQPGAHSARKTGAIARAIAPYKRGLCFLSYTSEVSIG